MKLTSAYFVIALITFGYSASDRSDTRCQSRFFWPPRPSTDCVVFSAFVAGLAWPLYWTWGAFDAGRAALEAQKEEER